MKFIYFPLLFLPISSLAQLSKAEELYHKIENYYQQNPRNVEFVEFTHKDPLSYDTVHSRFAYVPYNNKSFMIARFDDGYFVNKGFLSADYNYYLDASRSEKIKIRDKELEGTDYSTIEYIPSYNYNNLEKVFGSIKLHNKVKDQYQLFTSKYLLGVDTINYRINTVTRYDMFEGKIFYDQYRFILLPDSIQKFIREQSEALIEASKKFTVTTFKEIEKNRIRVKDFEGKKFGFQNLVSLNKGSLDSIMTGKYLILDFFYQSCYPCHIMTNWILDWLPSIDSSKIVLIGIDPRDSDQSIDLFIKERRINHPIISAKQAEEIRLYYGVSVFPTLFLISPDGIIQNIHEGMSKRFLKTTEKIVFR